MADEKPASGNANRNNNRRRNFRSRKRNASRPASVDAPPQPAAQSPDRDPARARRERRARRRRRNKGGQAGQYPAGATLPVEDQLDVVAPASVYIYTHVVRPVVRDSYEYRSEHFSKVSRQLEDFQIDLSALDRIEAEGILPPVTIRFTDDDEEGADEDADDATDVLDDAGESAGGVGWEDDEVDEAND